MKTIIPLSRGGFIIIGHRGAAGVEPENTLTSFAAALTCGCPMIELDVHHVQDEQNNTHLLVIHDDELDRTTSGKGLLSIHTFDQLRSLDAGHGQRIPTLTEVMTLLTEHHGRTGTKVSLNIELKGKQTAEATAQFVARYLDWPFLISSFNHDELFTFRQFDTDTPVAALYDRYDANWQETAKRLNSWAVNISVRSATERRIAAMRAAGYEVFVYTVNSTRQAQRLKSWGASGVFSDRPDKLMPLAE